MSQRGPCFSAPRSLVIDATVLKCPSFVPPRMMTALISAAHSPRNARARVAAVRRSSASPEARFACRSRSEAKSVTATSVASEPMRYVIIGGPASITVS